MNTRSHALHVGTPGPQTTWRIRWHQYRNRLIASPHFQRWAARTPLARTIANRRATQLHHITAGFVYSQTLLAFIELDLPQLLADGPAQTDRLVNATGLGEPALLTLLKAAHGLELLERYPGDLWGLGELGAALLANPGIAAMVRHHRHLYRDLSEPTRLLTDRNDTALSGYWAYEAVKSGAVDPNTYSELMASSQGMVADYVLDAVDLSGHAQLLDIAGGTGAFARRATQRFPNLRATVLDLPAVADAGNAAAEEGIPVRFVGGDMFRDALPTHADLISLVRVLHDHDDDAISGLLRRAFDALNPGGRLLIAEPLADTRGAEAIGATYFGFYLWAMGSGRPRSAPEISEFLAQAGFSNIREHKSPLPTLVRVITGDKTNSNI